MPSYLSGMISGLCYKHIKIVNDDTSVVNKFEASLTDDARVVIYIGYMFIAQATRLEPTQMLHSRPVL